jgi:hypothetical protein
MKGRYFRDISIVRAGGENNVPLPEADEVVVYRSFMKAGLRFPLDKLLVEVLKTFEIYLHQLTPEAIIKGWNQMRNASATSTSYPMRRRLLARSNITTILVLRLRASL